MGKPIYYLTILVEVYKESTGRKKQRISQYRKSVSIPCVYDSVVPIKRNKMYMNRIIGELSLSAKEKVDVIEITDKKEIGVTNYD